MFDVFWQDVRLGFRTWYRSRGLFCVAVLTLGLGVGSATALFGLVSHVLVKALPYREPDRLVILKAERDYDGTRQPVSAGFSSRAVEAWPSDLRAIEATAFYADEVIAITTNQGQELIDQAVVSGSFFDMLGGRFVAGRGLTVADDLQPVAVISVRLWQRLYGGAEDAVGRSITLNQMPYTIVGIVDRAFQFPDGSIDVWTPAGMARTRNPRCCVFGAVGRLLPDASVTAATEEASAVIRTLSKEVTALGGVRVRVVPLHEVVVGEARRALPILTAAVGLLVALACANVMNLLLVRQLSRAHETAVRRALGASRGRLVAQALVEGGVLATAAATIGVTLGVVVLRGLQLWQPAGVPRLESVHVDGAVLAFGVCAAVASTLIACLLSALRRDDVPGGVRVGQRGSTPSVPARVAMRTASVVQFALAVVLLVGATLLVRSLVVLLTTDLGVSTERVATASLNLSMNRALTDDQQIALVDRIVGRLASLSGVTAAGVGAARPPDVSRVVLTLKQPDETGNTYRAVAVPATPGYFRALGVRLERGRLFTEQDTALAPPVVVMSLDAARRRFGDTDPIGRKVLLPSVRNGRNEGVDMTVVGVTANVRYSGLDKAADDLFYRPFAQQTWRSVYLVVRTTGDPAVLAAQLPREVASIDRDIVVSEAMSMDDVLADVTAQPRFRTALLVGFASMAVVIAAVGLYGLIAYSVSQRTREIGVRMALGAATWHVKRMVLREAAMLVFVGVMAGIALAWMLSRMLASLLHGVVATDPVSFLLAATVAVFAGFSASLIPAWRAARTNPIEVLRQD